MNTTTQNGAVSLASTGQARLDFFSKALRDTSGPEIHRMLDAAWEESALDTLKLIFYKRDCRGGAGEKCVFYHSMSWLVRKNYLVFAVNRALIPEYGSWKDVLVVMDQNCTTLAYFMLLSDFCAQLRKDLEALDTGDGQVSLAAKWAPSEGKHFKRYVVDFANRLAVDGDGSKHPNVKAYYRKEYLSPLRAYINIVERLMCANDWKSINFSKVPSRATLKLKKAFERHEPERYAEWKASLIKGDPKVKVNVDQLDPPEFIRELWRGTATTDPELLDIMWNRVVEKAGELGTLGDALVVADVSGSMMPGCGWSSGSGSSSSGMAPIYVSLAFGLLVSQLSENYRDRIITFDTNPKFFKIKGTTLNEKFECLKAAPWGGSTNFQAVFDLILKNCETLAVDPPKRVICISDMQFNQADGNYKTNFQTIKDKFARAELPMPELVFWNVNGATDDFPVGADDAGVALVAGYNKAILKSVMTNKVVTPYDVMREAIDAPRYDRVTLN